MVVMLIQDFLRNPKFFRGGSHSIYPWVILLTIGLDRKSQVLRNPLKFCLGLLVGFPIKTVSTFRAERRIAWVKFLESIVNLAAKPWTWTLKTCCEKVLRTTQRTRCTWTVTEMVLHKRDRIVREKLLKLGRSWTYLATYL